MGGVRIAGTLTLTLPPITAAAESNRGGGGARRGESNDSMGEGEGGSAKAKWGGAVCLAFGEEKGPEIIAVLARRGGAQSMTCGTRSFGPTRR